MYKHYGDGTIRTTLDAIQKRNLVLPAIQREFVWSPEQICQFFDSLMQGYPFGTFLYWDVVPENSNKFKWYDFVRDYHERDNPHCPPHPVLHNTALTAVLDGQQRLTALNIGLQGSMAWKLPRLWWNNPDAFPTRYLYIDLLAKPNEEEGLKYRFEFLTETYGRRSSSENECWFKVSDIMGMDEGPGMLDWLMREKELSGEALKRSFSLLNHLHKIVHTVPIINYYGEQSQDIENVLQIFIRMNSGGTVLSYSDLLLSIAIAQWDTLDARKEILEFVDDLNDIGKGFNFSKDFVLKAGLMHCSINVGFRVANFNKPNMDKLEQNWPDVKRTLSLTVQLVDRFGFNRDNLSSTNALLPIAYYLHKADRSDNFLTHSDYIQDRSIIRTWLIRSLIKQGIWGSGLDSLLTALRDVIQDDDASFPITRVESAMAGRGKPLLFTEEEIEDMVDMGFGNRRIFMLLSLLFPFVDFEHQFHIDHIFPRAKFARAALISVGVPAEEHGIYFEMMNGLANLQLLEGAKNMEKQATLPTNWLNQEYPDPTARKAYIEMHLLGDVPAELDGFKAFYKSRRERLRERIVRLLGATSDTL